jgi:hypothetical protein
VKRAGKFNARRPMSVLPPETGYIQIGAFYIARRNDGTYWIERESGEGMQTGEAFEKAIAQFYKENF